MRNPADAEFAARLAALLPEGRLSAAEPRHLEEPRRRYRGMAGLLARPVSTDEVARIVAAGAAAAGVGIVPWGGGTGLVAGQLMPEAPGAPAPLVLSLERMTRLRGLWPGENVAIAEAGMTLAALRAAAAAGDGSRDGARLFPLTLASQGSCTIGGNLATNAGGVHVLRYGTARELCLGIEAVLPDGQVLSGLRRLRKDNTGYDIRDLLIGAEGTLGIITAAALRLFPVPAAEATALFSVPGPAAALRLLALAEARAAGLVSAFELIAGAGLDFLAEVLPELRQPFAPRPDWAVLVEFGLPRDIAPGPLLEDLFAEAAAAGLAGDAVVAQSEAQRAALWHLRESLPEANRRIGAIASHDIAVPLSALPEFIARAGERIAALGDMRVNCFGHVGDGNLHYNVFPARGRSRDDYDPLRPAIRAAVHDLVDDLGGSVSAEHGIGRLKTGDLVRYGDPVRLAAMRAVKAALDPAGIMNPGAVLAEAGTAAAG